MICSGRTVELCTVVLHGFDFDQLNVVLQPSFYLPAPAIHTIRNLYTHFFRFDSLWCH